ncbi:hypothetical protein [Streptomyces curacoi]|uniref:hypothetical protein n=1 Tax=Streptomyces curacoi TaxID=146536 RepID=UPI001ABFC563|nr:hypothetical protein [Streptomyces curacoi]
MRMGDGSLRGYKVKCGPAPTPSMAYTKLVAGWNAYVLFMLPQVSPVTWETVDP